MLMTLQDLTASQNTTLIGIVAGICVTGGALVAWIIKWLCGLFTTHLEKQRESLDQCNVAIGESTQVLRSLKESNDRVHDEIREAVDKLPERCELQRRKLG